MASFPVLGSVAVVKSGTARRSPAKVGGWLGVADTRDRKGRPLGSRMRVGGMTVEEPGSRWLSFSEMWTAYRRVPDIRAAFDSIVRRVATWDWLVEPTVDAGSAGFEALLDEAEAIRRFLAAPNVDGETWQELLTKLVTDLLVFDQAAIEVVSSTNKKTPVKELVAIRGSQVRPERDDHGRLKGYTQFPGSDDEAIGGIGEGIKFGPGDLVFFRLFPTTANSFGNPVIETILDEIVTVLRAAEHVMLAFDADEIPPGIVVLAGLTGPAATAAREDLQTMRGQDHKIRVLTTPDPSAVGAKWVELRHTPKDLSMQEIVQEVRHTIWRVIGVTPVEMGDTDGVNRATSQVQLEVGSSHLVNPILELIEAKINARIISAMAGANAGKIRFRFDRDAKQSAKEKLEAAQRLATLVDKGIMTRNEARKEEGLPPADGGDILTATGQWTTLDDIIEPPEPPPPLVPPGGAGGDEDPDPDGDGGGDGGVTDPEAGDAGEDDDAPGEVENARPAPETRQECMCRILSARLTADPGLDLDSEIARAYSECETLAAEAEAETGDRKGVARGKHVHSEKCGCAGRWGDTYALAKSGTIPDRWALLIELEHEFRRSRDLPSDWQPAGRFRGYRTLALPKLGDEISLYAQDARRIWREARDTVTAKLAASYRQGFGEDDAAAVLSALDDATRKLSIDWRAATGPRYMAAGKLGRDAAVDFSGYAEAGDGWEGRAERYFSVAMGYLTASDGPIEAAKRKARTAIQDLAKRPKLRAAEEDDKKIAASLAALAHAFDAEEFRVANYSGRLVELAHEEMTGTLGRATEAGADWWAEWVRVGDDRVCSTCEFEGGRGIQLLSAFSTVPGGNTECGGRCRCVLVLWSQAEVDSGKAIKLGAV